MIKKQTNTFLFDCSEESPKGRRRICYDNMAMKERKENPHGNNALNFAVEIGIEVLSVEQYRQLQELGELANKTSTWI